VIEGPKGDEGVRCAEADRLDAVAMMAERVKHLCGEDRAKAEKGRRGAAWHAHVKTSSRGREVWLADLARV